MTQIILTSNGNTPWDKDKIFQGSKDIPLDDLGREEAWAVGKWLKDENIHAVYTSPLSRARDTAIGRRVGKTWNITSINESCHLRGTLSRS